MNEVPRRGVGVFWRRRGVLNVALSESDFHLYNLINDPFGDGDDVFAEKARLFFSLFFEQELALDFGRHDRIEQMFGVRRFRFVSHNVFPERSIKKVGK